MTQPLGARQTAGRDESALVRSTLERLLATPVPRARFVPRGQALLAATRPAPQTAPEPAPPPRPAAPESAEAPPPGLTSLEVDESIGRAVEALRVEVDLRLREQAGLARGTVETISRETIRQALAPVEARLTQLRRRVTLALRLAVAAGLLAAVALQGLL